MPLDSVNLPMIFVLYTFSGEKFKESDAFIGYQKDTAAAVVFQASKQLESLQAGNKALLNVLKDCILFETLNLATLVTNERKGSHLWKQAVSVQFYYRMLVCVNVVV